MMSTRLFVVLSLAACSSPAEETVDAGVPTEDAPPSADAAPDAPPVCMTSGKVFVATRLGPDVEITAYDELITGGSEVAQVTCGAETTGLGVLMNGEMFIGLSSGGISRVTATACTPLGVTPAFTGEVALVGRGDELLALERTSGKLWRVDPTSGAATMLSTIPGAHTESSLVGGSEGAMVYVPAGLGGTGSLIALGANGQPGATRQVTGASLHQAQASWVSVVGDAGKLWLTMAGYFGAGGSPRTMWIPFQNDQLTAAAVEYYASTVAATAPTCP